MKTALPLLLVVALAPLAGCGAAQDSSHNEQQAAAAAQRAPDAEKVMAERWAQMFTHPASVVAAANAFYKASDYKAAGKGFATTGTVSLPEKPNGIAVESQFEAAGATADKVETIRFIFDVKHAAEQDKFSSDSYRYVPRIVNGFLARFEVGPGDTINAALTRRESATDTLHGVSAVVDAQPIKGGDAKDRHITVTFTRTGASAPANQTQGK